MSKQRAFPLIKDIKTANYADYLRAEPYVCCGWMDFHKDEPAHGGDSGFWTIQPHFWSRKAAFVHKVDGRYVLVMPTKKKVTFNYRKPHALLPIELAKKVIEKQHFRFAEYRKFKSGVEKEVQAKLVWTWDNP